jgi:hypothetical protein
MDFNFVRTPVSRSLEIEPARLSIPASIKEKAIMEIVSTPLAKGKSDPDIFLLSETTVMSKRNMGKITVKIDTARILKKHLKVLVKVPKTCIIRFGPPESGAPST